MRIWPMLRRRNQFQRNRYLLQFLIAINQAMITSELLLIKTITTEGVSR